MIYIYMYHDISLSIYIYIMIYLCKTGSRHVEFADTQDPLNFSPAQDPVQIYLRSTRRPDSVLEELKAKSPQTGFCHEKLC